MNNCRLTPQYIKIYGCLYEVNNEVWNMKNTSKDKGGRRSGIERRQFSYDEYLPERRSGKDRRSGFDRRTKER
jgi:hypothetical protein